MEISVCLIVKNEEIVLERCLNCVNKFADEIIIVDTGSTDKTIEIAKRFTNKIFNFKWVEDFSKARNFSFSKATKDYIMWIDADDIITNDNILKIQKLKKNSENFDVFMLKYDIFSKKTQKITISFYRERIIKNCKFATWQGFIHEAIAPFGRIKYTDISVEHHKEKVNKKNRNLNIYNYHLKHGVQLNSREKYYYAKELYYSGYLKKCVKELKSFLKDKNLFYPNVIDSYITISSCYQKLNLLEKAKVILYECLIKYNPNAELFCKIAEIELLKNNKEKAILFYKNALMLKPDYKTGCFINQDFYTIIPSTNLTMLYYQLSDYKKAKFYHKLSKTFDPKNTTVLYNEQFFLN